MIQHDGRKFFIHIKTDPREHHKLFKNSNENNAIYRFQTVKSNCRKPKHRHRLFKNS